MGAIGLNADPERFAALQDGVRYVLQDATPDAQIYLTSMRPNPVQPVWNVEMTIKNAGSKALRGPFRLYVDVASGFGGTLVADGVDALNEGRAYFDVAAQIPGGVLMSGATSAARTLSLPRTAERPVLRMRLFCLPPSEPVGLASVRTTDEMGHPLPGVEIQQRSGLGEEGAFRSDAWAGVATVGGAPGAYTWRFSLPQYLPVWRTGGLVEGSVGILPGPRLTRRSTNVVAIAAGEAGQLMAGGVRVQLTAGSLGSPTLGTLTPLSAQALPGLLPLGWSPLQAGWLELRVASNGTPVLEAPGVVTAELWDSLGNGERAVLASWDVTNLVWVAMGFPEVVDARRVSGLIPGPGAFAVVVPDAGLKGPPPAVVGMPLRSAEAVAWDVTQLTASGHVEPPVRFASREASLVSAQAMLTISNTAGPLVSGMLFRGEVSERYQLRDGGSRSPLPYDTAVVAYARPGDGLGQSLGAWFPMRPMLLLGSDELVEATVQFDLKVPREFRGGVLGPHGGVLEVGEVRVLANAGDLDVPQAVLIRLLDPELLPEVAVGPSNVVAAFDLLVGAPAAGRRLAMRIGVPGDHGDFVLARVTYEGGLVGVAPVALMQRGADRAIWNREPAPSPALPGVGGSGRFIVVRTPGPQGVVSGQVRDAQNQPATRGQVRVEGQPWSVFAGVDGRYQVTAPAGSFRLRLLDLGTGDSGVADATMEQVNAGVSLDVSAGAHGPQVSAVTPAAGARGVARVTSVVVEFDRALDPSGVVAGGVALVVRSNQAPVSVSLSLNLQNTVVTLLPQVQLAPSTEFEVRVAADLKDTTGRPLEGERVFSFVTRGAELDRSAAHLMSYEPVNGLARLAGTPGIADPESPVILVNETTGRTATVLSKPDGSFDNVIEAEVDDFLSAVMVNQNGTRNTVPVSRQVYRDGGVALFHGGGILEAQSDGGPVEIQLEPGSISSKTKFNVQSLSALQIQELLASVPPADGAKLLGGFSVKLDGDIPAAGQAHVRVPVDPASLGVPPGQDPEDGVYVLTRVQEVGGVKVYEVVDDMSYENGGLVTHSFEGPFANLSPSNLSEGYNCVALALGFGGHVRISGRVFSRGAPGSTEYAVPGATVFVVPSGQNLSTNGRVNTGVVVATADDNGSFQLLGVRVAGKEAAFSLLATSPLFPGHYGVGSASVDNSDWANVVARGVVAFSRSSAAAGLGIDDHTPPLLSLSHTPQAPGTNEVAMFHVFATDNADSPSLQVNVVSATALDPTQTITTADVSSLLQSSEHVGQSSRWVLKVTCRVPGTVVLEVQALDGSGNPAVVNYPISFGQPGQAAPPLDPTDHETPFVLQSVPREGARDVNRFEPIRLRFSEPIQEGILTNLAAAIQLAPPAGTPWATLSPDGRELSLQYPRLVGGVAYTLTANSNIRDINGNPLDQMRYGLVGFYEPFTLFFTTKQTYVQALDQMSQGGGVVGAGDYLYALDRKAVTPNQSLIRVYKRDDQDVITLISDVTVPSYPRDLVFIPNWAYRDSSLVAHTNDLIVVAGGLVGNAGQWIHVYNASNPFQLRLMASTMINRSPSSVVVKLAWSPPVIGYLEYDDAASAIGLIDLQLFLYAQTIGTLIGQPDFGDPGTDLNGDGDYVDAGESIPLPAGKRVQSGVINGGLVGGYVLPMTPSGATATERITDFALALGGRLVAAVHGPGRNGEPAGFRTLAINGVPLQRPAGFFPFPRQPDRVLTVLGVELSATNRVYHANLALVSGGKDGVITCLDITRPDQPEFLSDIVVPVDQGRPLSAKVTTNGMVLVATTRNLLLLNPSLLARPATSSGHPAVVGLIPGVGQGGQSWFSDGPGFFAVNHGGRYLASSTHPPNASLFQVQEVVAVDRNTDQERLSRNGRIEVVMNDDETMLFNAIIAPADLSLPANYPGWLKDGIQPQTGPTVLYTIPGYSVAGQAVPNWMLALAPQTYAVKAESTIASVRVFPAGGAEIKADMEPINQVLTNYFTKLRNLTKSIPCGIYHFDVEVSPPEGKVSFQNEWKECPNSHLAYCAFSLGVKFDPLIQVAGKVSVGIDNLSLLGRSLALDLFIQPYGKFDLGGTLERGECGQFTGQIALGGDLGITLGGEAKFGEFLETSVVGEGRYVASGTVVLDTRGAVLKPITASRESLNVKFAFKLEIGGIEWERRIQIADRTDLLPDPPPAPQDIILIPAL